MLNSCIRAREHIVGHDAIFAPNGLLIKIYQQTLNNKTKLPNLLLYGFPSSGKRSFAINYYNFYKQYCTQQKYPCDEEYKVKEYQGAELNVKLFSDMIDQTRLTNQSTKTLVIINHASSINKLIQNRLLSILNHKQIVLVLILQDNKMIGIQPLLRKDLIPMYFQQLTPMHGLKILIQTINNNNNLFNKNLELDQAIESPQCLALMAQAYKGNVRQLLNMLWLSITQEGFITLESVNTALSMGEQGCYNKESVFYDLLSGLQKSIRASDVQSALYFTASLLKIQTPVDYILRRLIIIAYEDIGLADPHAAVVAVSCKQALDAIGLPEGRIPLSNCVIYLAMAPKNNDAYMAINRAQQYIDNLAQNYEALPPRDGYRNELGAEYPYPHDLGTYILERVVQKEAQDAIFYIPTQRIMPQ